MVYTIKHRPLIAIPSAPIDIKLRAIKCFPAITIKRRVLRFVFLISAVLRLDVLFSKPLQDSLIIHLEYLTRMLKDMYRDFEQEVFHLVLVWPGDPGRGRVYCYVLDAGGQRIAFAKIALNSKNIQALENEVAVVNDIAGKASVDFRVPRVLGQALYESGAVVLYESIPASPDELIKGSRDQIRSLIAQYQGPIFQVSELELESSDWWRKVFLGLSNNSALEKILTVAKVGGMNACCVHGDLNRTNIFIRDTSIWICDWEQSTRSGPRYTDLVCFELDLLWGALGANNELMAIEFFALESLFSSEAEDKEIALALAYLVSVGYTPAQFVLSKWPELN